MNNKDYWENVKKVREDIYSRMINSGVNTVKDDGDINPFYDQIIENGGIGLELYYGEPSKIYTPLGYIHIVNGFTSREKNNQEEFLKELKEKYGLITVLEGKQSKQGYFGPYYSITKLPWEPGKEIPIFEWKKKKDYTEHNIAKDIFEKYYPK